MFAGLSNLVIFPFTVTQNLSRVAPLPVVNVDWHVSVASGETASGIPCCFDWAMATALPSNTAANKIVFFIFEKSPCPQGLDFVKLLPACAGLRAHERPGVFSREWTNSVARIY